MLFCQAYDYIIDKRDIHNVFQKFFDWQHEQSLEVAIRLSLEILVFYWQILQFVNVVWHLLTHCASISFFCNFWVELQCIIVKKVSNLCFLQTSLSITYLLSLNEPTLWYQRLNDHGGVHRCRKIQFPTL